ncbi:hypothetical protein KC353_g4 [Hortaea werneckii]|nr:hypothetical protein KC353_g4 [Hortaea werneckii]
MREILANTATERISFADRELLSQSGKSLLQRPSRSNLERKVSICIPIRYTPIRIAIARRYLETFKGDVF